MGQRDRLKGIADAIREKTGSTKKIKATDFVTEISNVYNAGEKSEYDRFWDSFQQNGTRTDYQYVFAGMAWNNNTFKPKYDIKCVGETNYLFKGFAVEGDFAELLTNLGINLDLSEATNIEYMFHNSNGITRLPKLDLSNASVVLYSFFSAWRLKTIDKLITTMETGRTGGLNMFSSIKNLEELTIEGVLGYAGLSLATAPKLNKASHISVINALSTTTSGLSVTLSKTAVDNAFETTTGKADGSTSTEWTTLIATKNNWTIVLA
jgi:hypothetical protein